jgi:hypothetical protein
VMEGGGGAGDFGYSMVWYLAGIRGGNLEFLEGEERGRRGWGEVMRKDIWWHLWMAS